LIKRVCLGTSLPAPTDARAIRELMRINADLARLGGLFKMAISQHDTPEMRHTAKEIAACQDDLKRAIKELYRVRR
jgi:hypothetical protein